MLLFRRFFLIAAAAAFIILAAAWVLVRLNPTPVLPTLVPTLTLVPTETISPTPRPTNTLFVFPTLASSPTATFATMPPSATVVPATPTASVTPTALPLSTATATPEAPTPQPPPTTITYTIVISDVFARREPNVSASLFQPLERGRSYTVTAQSPDGIWFQLELSPDQPAVWVPVAFGLTYSTRVAVPLAGPTLTPASIRLTATTSETATLPAYPYVIGLSDRARDIYRYGLLLGNSPHAFMKIGDCQAKYPFFLSAFDTAKSYRLGDTYAYLQETIRQFPGSFKRDSVAAQTGFGTATVLDPQWANPNLCEPGESPLICEYRTQRPSLAIISLGTNDIWQPDGRHEKNMRQIIDYLIRQGVVPILSTKADNVEGDGSFNRLMVQLAEEYQLPLWDFWQVTRDLPENGLVDVYHLSWGPAIFDDPKNMLLGWPWRNLTGLQALDAVWRTVR